MASCRPTWRRGHSLLQVPAEHSPAESARNDTVAWSSPLGAAGPGEAPAFLPDLADPGPKRFPAVLRRFPLAACHAKAPQATKLPRARPSDLDDRESIRRLLARTGGGAQGLACSLQQHTA